VKIKAQRSLETTEKVPQALFYNKDRSWEWQGQVPGHWEKLFAEHGPKIFAAVEWKVRRAAPKFKHLLGDQGW